MQCYWYNLHVLCDLYYSIVVIHDFIQKTEKLLHNLHNIAPDIDAAAADVDINRSLCRHFLHFDVFVDFDKEDVLHSTFAWGVQILKKIDKHAHMIRFLFQPFLQRQNQDYSSDI